MASKNPGKTTNFWEFWFAQIPVLTRLWAFAELPLCP